MTKEENNLIRRGLLRELEYSREEAARYIDEYYYYKGKGINSNALGMLQQALKKDKRSRQLVNLLEKFPRL